MKSPFSRSRTHHFSLTPVQTSLYRVSTNSEFRTQVKLIIDWGLSQFEPAKDTILTSKALTEKALISQPLKQSFLT